MRYADEGAFRGSRIRSAFWLVVFLFIFCPGLTPGTVLGDDFDTRSVSDGKWTDPETWGDERVPKAGDRVLVSSGTTVTYDARSEAILRSLFVSGALNFARDRDTLLQAGMILVGSNPRGKRPTTLDPPDEIPPKEGTGPVLQVGSPYAPIPRPHTARIRLHYIEGMKKTDAPGMICLPGGRMEFHGAPMSRTWVELGRTAEPGQKEVLLSRSVSGWEKGDQIMLTGSRHKEHIVGGTFRNQQDKLQTELKRLSQQNGRTLILDEPLKNVHSGNGDQRRGRSEIANLTRTVVVESAQPDGVRGHTMYHRHSSGSISYARFESLGKKNTLGRYPIHFHRVRDTMRGSSVIGASIVDSHNRWVTIHNTQYLVVRDCVGYRSIGHGYFLEDGTEVYNVLDRNLGVQAFKGQRLPHQALPFDHNRGAAFWWANGRNTFIRNVSCENDRYGFRYDSQQQSNFDSRLSIRMPSGKNRKRDIRNIPVYRFEGNESHTEALYSFVFSGTEGAGPDTNHPHRLKGLQAWQTHYALRPQLPNMMIEQVWIHHAPYGLYRPRFDNHVYRDFYIAHSGAEPFNRGQDDRSEQHGKLTVDGLTFAGLDYGSHSMPLIQISDNNLSGEAESHFRHVRVDRSGKRGDRWPVVNRGGGREVPPETPTSVPVYLHDWYGSGATAKVVSVKANNFGKDNMGYQQDPPLTGPEARVTTVSDVPFPRLLNPVDDQPPATIVLRPRPMDRVVIGEEGTLTVYGTTTDNREVQSVTVNGRPVSDAGMNYHQWKVKLRNLKPGPLTITAKARDTSGNVEKTPHSFRIMLRTTQN